MLPCLKDLQIRIESTFEKGEKHKQVIRIWPKFKYIQKIRTKKFEILKIRAQYENAVENYGLNQILDIAYNVW